MLSLYGRTSRKIKSTMSTMETMMPKTIRRAECNAAELVDDERYKISKAALITDCEPGPLCVVHLTLDCTDCRKARCAQEVERKERIAADHREVGSHVAVNRAVTAAIEDTKRTDNVLLRNKTGDGSTAACQLPQPSGAKIQAIALPMVARMLLLISSSVSILNAPSTTPK